MITVDQYDTGNWGNDWNQATTAQLKFYQEFREETLPVAGSRHHVKSDRKRKKRDTAFYN